MTQNPFTACPVIWAAILIEAQADGDVERVEMAIGELRRLGFDNLRKFTEFLEKSWIDY